MKWSSGAGVKLTHGSLPPSADAATEHAPVPSERGVAGRCSRRTRGAWPSGPVRRTTSGRCAVDASAARSRPVDPAAASGSGARRLPARTPAPRDRAGARARICAGNETRLHLRLLDRVRLDVPDLRDLPHLRRVPARPPLPRPQPPPARAARRRERGRLGAGRRAGARRRAATATSSGSPRTSTGCARSDARVPGPGRSGWCSPSSPRGIVQIIVFVLLDGDLVKHDYRRGWRGERAGVHLHAARHAGRRARSGVGCTRRRTTSAGSSLRS